MKTQLDKGFIGIGILLLILIISSKTITNLEKLTTYKIDLDRQRTKIKSKYINRSKIYTNIYNESNFQQKIANSIAKKYREYDYYSIICLNPECSKTSCNGINCKGSYDYIYCELDPTKSRKHIRVLARTSLYNVTSFDEMYFSIINQNFLEDIPVNKNIENVDFYNLIEEIYKTNFNIKLNSYEINDEKNIYLDRVEDYYILLSSKEYIFSDNEIFIFIKNKNKDSNLYINSRNGEDIKIDGIIFVDGNIYIDTNFKFNGIMICTGNIYFRDNCFIEGKILCNNFESEKHLTINYKEKKMLYYGSYLPGFFKVKIVEVKEG